MLKIDLGLVQYLVHQAAMISTKMALQGRPLSAMRWVPPKDKQDIRGSFEMDLYMPDKDNEHPPWNTPQQHIIGVKV
jgi:hypothetical protein